MLLLKRDNQARDRTVVHSGDNSPGAEPVGSPCVVGIDSLARHPRRPEKSDLVAGRLPRVCLRDGCSTNKRPDWDPLENHLGIGRKGLDHLEEVSGVDGVVEPSNVGIE